VITVELAARLKAAGLAWKPVAGDRFVIADRDMDEDVFTISDMTVEVHEFPNEKVIGFNGTTEWALDSVELQHSVWLPSETQLRELLAGTFRALEPTDSGWRVTTEVLGQIHHAEDVDAAEAYALALLHLLDQAMA
jgi:enamine deaminase RidA (YjgF/YER057c/UK114 family)